MYTHRCISNCSDVLNGEYTLPQFATSTNDILAEIKQTSIVMTTQFYLTKQISFNFREKSLIYNYVY